MSNVCQNLSSLNITTNTTQYLKEHCDHYTFNWSFDRQIETVRSVQNNEYCTSTSPDTNRTIIRAK